MKKNHARRECVRAAAHVVRTDIRGGDELAGAIASALDRRLPRPCEPAFKETLLSATEDMLRALVDDPSLNLEAWAEQVGLDPTNAVRRAREATVTYGDLRRLRKLRGGEAVDQRLARGTMVELAPYELLQHAYVSQTFVSEDGLRRALLREDAAALPCFVEIDPDGGIKFVLIDGHHRALRNAAQSERTILCVDDRPMGAKAIMSFRKYYASYGRDVRD